MIYFPHGRRNRKKIRQIGNGHRRNALAWMCAAQPVDVTTFRYDDYGSLTNETVVGPVGENTCLFQSSFCN
ncbi:MAG: hypothetical protein IKL96_02850 [Kiritimatiellae bacterium]|nr:hypothetical protein [Kiritimatiellia bacterium]